MSIDCTQTQHRVIPVIPSTTEACGDHQPLEEATAGVGGGLGVGSAPRGEVVHDGSWGSTGAIGICATSRGTMCEVGNAGDGRNS